MEYTIDNLDKIKRALYTVLADRRDVLRAMEAQRSSGIDREDLLELTNEVAEIEDTIEKFNTGNYDLDKAKEIIEPYIAYGIAFEALEQKAAATDNNETIVESIWATDAGYDNLEHLTPSEIKKLYDEYVIEDDEEITDAYYLDDQLHIKIINIDTGEETDYMPDNHKLTEDFTDISGELNQWAQEDVENGTMLNREDFDEFKHLLIDNHPELETEPDESFEKWFEEYFQACDEFESGDYFDDEHAEEFIERNPHGYYNSENDYGDNEGSYWDELDSIDTDYGTAYTKMDAFMEDSKEATDAFYAAKSVDELTDVLTSYIIDEDTFYGYAGPTATIEGFAQYIIDHNLNNDNLDENLMNESSDEPDDELVIIVCDTDYENSYHSYADQLRADAFVEELNQMSDKDLLNNGILGYCYYNATTGDVYDMYISSNGDHDKIQSCLNIEDSSLNESVKKSVEDEIKDLIDKMNNGEITYEEFYSTLQKFDRDEKDRILANLILNGDVKKSFKDDYDFDFIAAMSREELEKEIDSIYDEASRNHNYDIIAIIEDPELFNENDSTDEGYFEGVPTDRLKKVLNVLLKIKNGQTINHDELESLTEGKKKEKALGAFVKLNAGDPEKNQETFNKNMTPNTETTAGETGAISEDIDTPDTLVTYNSAEEYIDYKTVDLNNSRELGIHCGTLQAAAEKHPIISRLTLSNYKEYNIPFDLVDIWSSPRLIYYMDFLTDAEKAQLRNSLGEFAADPDKYQQYSRILRNAFLDAGYNLISYINEIEDAGSTSYIILDTAIIVAQEEVTNEIDIAVEPVDTIEMEVEPEVETEDEPQLLEKLIDIRKGLLHIDFEYGDDLLGMYDSLKLDNDTKAEIARLINENNVKALTAFIQKLYNKIMEPYSAEDVIEIDDDEDNN